MCSPLIKDKDGISALAVFYESANALYAKNQTVSSYLDTLYQKYGYWVSNNGYYICRDPVKTQQIFDKIRYGKGTSGVINFPSTLAGMKVISVRDLTVGFDSSKIDNKPILPVSSASQMITFRFENSALVTLRTSGTEPKIKFYTEYKGETLASAQKTLDDMVKLIIAELLDPVGNGLEN